jgi:hypothetical protein
MMPTSRFDRTEFTGAAEGEPYADPAPEDGSAKGPEAFRHLQSQLEELADYARLYASAKKDALTSSVRRAALWAATGVIAATIAVSTVVTATVLTLVGLAQFLGEALGDRLWAGYLLTGGGFLILLAIGVWVTLTTLQSKFRQQTVKKYESRHNAQRARFEHDETTRSRAQP